MTRSVAGFTTHAHAEDNWNELRLPRPDNGTCSMVRQTNTTKLSMRGWFRHSNVTRNVMELAGQLLDAGANHVRLYQTMEQNETPGRLKLISRALNSLDLRLDNRLALMTLTQDDLRESGALPGETGGLTDFTQGIASVQVSGVLLEVPGDKPGTRIVKISLRSKPGPVDVNAIAGTLGGGGHVRAAGAKVKLTLDEAKDAVTRLVAEQLS